MWIVIAVVSGIVIIAIASLRIIGRGFPWFQFFIKGKESGFSFREVNLLRKVAVENKLRDPTSLFWSIKQLDDSIRGMILRVRAHGKEDDETSIQFISKLFEFRKRVEFKLPKYRLGLKSTRHIIPNQKIKVTFEGGGVYHSVVIENMRKYIAVSYPRGPLLPPGFLWKNRKINVYFWRAEDAGYYFESRVIDDFTLQNYSILHLSHSSQLIRSQKRRSHRCDVNCPGKVFVLKSLNLADEIWSEDKGLRCRVINISENGLAVLVGGRAKPGIPVKTQCIINDKQVVMSGTVKGVTYDNKKSQSILHIEAVQPSHRIKNSILMHVYGIFSQTETRQPPNKHLQFK